MNTEDLLNGGYGGLFGEVVTADIYRLESVPFYPDIVFDIGANIGIFSRYARSLFPWAKIYAVEPHPDNCKVFEELRDPTDPNIWLWQAALGTGPIYHVKGDTQNGSGEVYLSEGLGYPQDVISSQPARWEKTNIPNLTLAEIITPIWTPGQKTILKIDCEGAENFIWQDEPSMEILKQMDYIAMELHSYAEQAKDVQKVKDITALALNSLSETHYCERHHVHFWGTKA